MAELNYTELRDWVALSMAKGLGPRGIKKLAEQFGSASSILDTPVKFLESSGMCSPKQASALNDTADLRLRADQEIKKLKRLGARPLVCGYAPYPALLSEVADPPPVLYAQGRVEELDNEAVALVGSRSATSYGKKAAFRLAQELGGTGMSVVSGLAAGIDAQAHLGCMNSGGLTVGVLGCGLDVVYPRINKEIYQRMSREGIVLSEYPLGTKPDGFRFPARNRIIAGLCLGVVVVEAAKRSGSLITVQFALDEGREVCAVPGQVDSAKSMGTHWLIKQGATLVTSAEDVRSCLGLEGGTRSNERKMDQPSVEKLDSDARRLYQLLEEYPMSRQELVQETGFPIALLNQCLLVLELEGFVEMVPGDMVRCIS